ncbi:zinc knuckle, partial [Ostertagia ostertagi]
MADDDNVPVTDEAVPAPVQPKVYQLTEEALQSIIHSRDGPSTAPALSHTFKRTEKAVSLLSARNELLIEADEDVSVFAFYDQQKKAEKTKDPILCRWIKKKESETKTKSIAWKSSRFDPVQRSPTPFRFQRAAWAPVPPQFVPQTRSYTQMEVQGTSNGSRMEVRPSIRGALPRDMCYGCGRFGHFASDCKFNRRSK